MFSRPKLETIDQVVEREELARKARASQERQRRFDLSKQLGDRAMQGEAIGIKGFMAIGFPNLTPESKEYNDLVSTCYAVKRIAAGRGVAVGHKFARVLGVKADVGDKGLAFRIQPEASGNYYAHAEVLCTRAIYEHSPASTATIYGTDERPYAVGFIEGYQGQSMVSPVEELVLADGSADSRDHFINGDLSYTERYTQRLMEEAVLA